MPASASTSPSDGRITATPPKRPASAVDRGALDLGVDRRAHRAAAARRDRCEHALAGAQLAAGAAGQLGVELALQPGQPDRRVGRHAAAGELGRALGRRRPDAARDLRGERAELRQPRLALGQRRAVARLDRRARRQRRACASASRPRRRPGCTRYGRQSIAAPSSSSTTGSATRPESVPKMRVRSTTGTETAPSCGSAGRPASTRRERRHLARRGGRWRRSARAGRGAAPPA